MFELCANKTSLRVCAREAVTSGSVNVYPVRFAFSEDWEGLTRTAVFRAGAVCRSVLLDGDACEVPWEVLEHHGPRLECGVYGTDSAGEIVLPTVWADLGMILEGAAPGEAARPPTPELWEQELNAKGDTLDYTPEGELGLYAGERLLSAVPISGGGGEGGVSDHRLLTGRDAPNQHPISAVDGLEEILERIPRPMTADELRKILMNGE